MQILKPACLQVGDTIGIVSPASPIAAYCPRRFERGVQTLERMGFKVLVSEHARALHGHTAGTIAERVDDLHGMFQNPEVKAIITSIGGYNSNQLLDKLDYDLIRANPKIFLGYSDITALHLGIHKMTGLVTFLGPAVMPQFGEFDGLHPYTENWLKNILMAERSPGEVEPSCLTIHEQLSWDKEDHRARQVESHPGPKVLRPGTAEGRIVAGNLGTMLALAGSPYFPKLEGALLMVEEDETESPDTMDRFLTQLRLMGAFEAIAALGIGRFHPKVGFDSADSLESIVMEATDGFDLPIAIDFDFGHTDPMLTLPQGIHARVDFTAQARFELLESGVHVLSSEIPSQPVLNRET